SGPGPTVAETTGGDSDARDRRPRVVRAAAYRGGRRLVRVPRGDARPDGRPLRGARAVGLGQSLTAPAGTTRPPRSAQPGDRSRLNLLIPWSQSMPRLHTSTSDARRPTTVRLRARSPKELTFATVPVPTKEAGKGGAGAAAGRHSDTRT